MPGKDRGQGSGMRQGVSRLQCRSEKASIRSMGSPGRLPHWVVMDPLLYLQPLSDTG